MLLFVFFFCFLSSNSERWVLLHSLTLHLTLSQSLSIHGWCYANDTLRVLCTLSTCRFFYFCIPHTGRARHIHTKNKANDGRERVEKKKNKKKKNKKWTVSNKQNEKSHRQKATHTQKVECKVKKTEELKHNQQRRAASLPLSQEKSKEMG